MRNFRRVEKSSNLPTYLGKRSVSKISSRKRVKIPFGYIIINATKLQVGYFYWHVAAFFKILCSPKFYENKSCIWIFQGIIKLSYSRVQIFLVSSLPLIGLVNLLLLLKNLNLWELRNGKSTRSKMIWKFIGKCFDRSLSESKYWEKFA